MGHIHKKFWINRWLKTCSLGETKEGGSRPQKRTGCLRWVAVVLLRAELATHLQTKNIAPNGDMLAAVSKINFSVFGVSRVAVSRLPPETNRTGSKI